jgi:hypothetical protein
MSSDNPLIAPPVETIDDAIQRMEDITAYIVSTQTRGVADGVACFTFLYTTITKRVRDGINTGFFADGAFLSKLDVTFANRYFAALQAAATSQATPRSWQVLIDARADQRVESIQFAMAGVNAHINFDLALAVIDTCVALGTRPQDGSQHADYQKINQIFGEEMQNLREHFESSLVLSVDKATSPVLNLIDDNLVVVLRDGAWEVAEHFAELRRVGVSEATLTKRLDEMAATSGRLLLTPLA